MPNSSCDEKYKGFRGGINSTQGLGQGGFKCWGPALKMLRGTVCKGEKEGSRGIGALSRVLIRREATALYGITYARLMNARGHRAFDCIFINENPSTGQL